MKFWSLRVAALSVLFFAQAACAQSPQVLHTEQSKFEKIVVYEQAGERCMKFGSLASSGRQTCLKIQKPQTLLFDYTRMMLGALYLKPDAQRILIVGLGGGSLPTALHQLLPQAQIDTVEIDPAVVAVARRFFYFKTDASQRVHVADGRAFVQQAVRNNVRYDLVMLDAFDVNYIPPHLLTREFLTEVKRLLTPDGVLAANTFSASRMYEDESQTYAAVFGSYYNLRAANRVILASAGNLPSLDQIKKNADRLDSVMSPLGVSGAELLPRFSTRKDWPDSAKVLTD
jgi:spermidine synthase